ncbi:unnamed protein product [Trichogramma brassicae]|uniref:Integrase catalytic domain-containing protein n=1 Tax=Trichogramma brassicae TaxID=86971 RepID=A0A6H5HWN6_9HYME|nr:unnamed protein product [Trichogramma brassicae]
MNPTERANRTIKTMIASYVGANHRDWDKHLHELRHAMNTAVQSSTRVSPAFLNYGRHPRPVKSLRREVETPAVECWEIDETVWLDRISRLDAIRDLVKLHLDKAHARQARHYNRGRKDVRFAEGDLVMRRTHHLSVGAENSVDLWRWPTSPPFLPTRVAVGRRGELTQQIEQYVSDDLRLHSSKTHRLE